ncbi:SET domain-containing protein [Lichtheimia hyalospora FSU 10163]|nr:SET domain-containing protein [Lichtheimia hyalospora FSU 10163]
MSKSNAVHSAPTSSYTSTEDELDIDDEPVDTGLIRCICNSSEDDGFTIQCERCLVWQHAFCVNISQHNIPEHYLCERCDKRFRYVISNDMDLVENEERPTLRLRTRPDASTRRRGGGVGAAATTTTISATTDDKYKIGDKHHFRDIHNRMQSPIHDDDEYKPGSTKRPSSHQRTKSNAGRPPSKKPKLSKRIPVSKKSWRELEEDPARQPSSSRRKTVTTTTTRFQLVNANTIRSIHVPQTFKEANERWKKMEQQQRLPIHFVVMKESDLSISIPKATVRPLSKSFYTLNDTSEPLTGMFADAHIPANQLVAEINGDILLKSEYKFNHENDFTILGTPCVHVFFYPTIDLCIDARHRGNPSRSIRRSCHPNAELRSIITTNDDDIQVRLGIFSRADIDKGQEITIGWNWQRGHISWKKNVEWHSMMSTGGVAHQVMDEQEERSNRMAVASMLALFDTEFVDCACHDREICFIEHLRRNSNMLDKDWRPKTRPSVGVARSQVSNGVDDVAATTTTVTNNLQRQPGKRSHGQLELEDRHVDGKFISIYRSM